jgi:ABC-2 type transport system ATP-binding protein
LIELRSVCKVYGGVTVVDHVNLSIPQGVCYGLLGPNGAGKSTCISILVGILAADSGEVILEGKRLDPKSKEQKKTIGFVPQDLALYEELSALENLNFFGSLYDLSGPLLEERIERVLTITGLADRKGGPVRLFSGGMKRRLNIGIALLHDPAFLVLDEPTVGVDPQSRNLIFEALEQLVREGKTILYTTHYMEEIERLCSRVAIMDQGRVLADDTLEALLRTLPESRTIELEFETIPSEEVVRSLAQTVEWQPGSHSIRAVGGAASGSLIDELQAIELELGPIKGVTTLKPTLEQVFLNFTGRRLRD